MNKYLILLLLYYACWPGGKKIPSDVKNNLLANITQYTKTAVYFQNQLFDCRENRLFCKLLNKKDQYAIKV
jgi:uncharacterized protein YdaU (DUF1376 family)